MLSTQGCSSLETAEGAGVLGEAVGAGLASAVVDVVELGKDVPGDVDAGVGVYASEGEREGGGHSA